MKRKRKDNRIAVYVSDLVKGQLESIQEENGLPSLSATFTFIVTKYTQMREYPHVYLEDEKGNRAKVLL